MWRRPPVQAPVLRLEEVLTEAPLPMEFAEWAEPAVETVAAPEPSRPLRNGLPALYLLGVLAAGGWLLAGYLRMAQLMRKARRHKADGVTWCLTPCAVRPFSWGRYVVLSEEEFNESPLVRLHERMHVARRHSIDGTLMQLVKVVQWFNPAAHLLVHELKQLHEYQADRDVCRHPIDTKQYQRLLVKKAVGAHLYALASAFSQPP